METNPPTLSRTFNDFFESEKLSGVFLIACTMLSIAIANSFLGPSYAAFWHAEFLGMPLEHWVNDGLMAVFFLFVGLELERELYNGELSSLKKSTLPILAALGGVALPAFVHFTLNSGTPTLAGAGIPMATDIAFALGVLAMLGSRIPATLKIFLTAFAVMDDLAAIVVIAVFYTAQLSLAYLAAAMCVFLVLIFLNRSLRIMALTPYLIGGALMWFLMLKSGIHATLSGVLLAFAIPFSAKAEDMESPSHRLEHALHQPVAFLILPIFALANTGIVITADWSQALTTANSAGIIAGLLLGKPVGIFLASWAAIRLGVCRLPAGLRHAHILGAGLLGGIGFTMSIFITNLAFPNDAALVNASKMAILLASLSAGLLGYLWLRLAGDDSRQSPP